ncbi:hypothetical protein H5J24_07440 [Chryseobacterium capnotolerans]|uniref:bacteriocin-like protein n=1 Tax=Chryseobacterium TaxID=59732 RepID=UPI000A5932CE|nr:MULTISPECIES: hypothetical protein [Chryseobacterium]UHO39862.1 hypothetical protein H5J24_07440 [Chryseobacterium capnotolerans]
MKNLKKITRDSMKSIKGAGPTFCRVGYIYMCASIYECIPEQDIWDCACGCVPVTRNF